MELDRTVCSSDFSWQSTKKKWRGTQKLSSKAWQICVHTYSVALLNHTNMHVVPQAQKHSFPTMVCTVSYKEIDFPTQNDVGAQEAQSFFRDNDYEDRLRRAFGFSFISRNDENPPLSSLRQKKNLDKCDTIS